MNKNTLKNILQYIDDHIRQGITLETLAGIAGYSPFYFSRLFSEHMGISVTSYIRIRKLQFSLADLLAGGKVIDVAMQYSFESHEGYTRSFTKLFGSTPKTARKYLSSYEIPPCVIPALNQQEDNLLKTTKNMTEDMHQILFEFLSQSMAEAEEGYCTAIQIELLPGNRIRIRDNGRGLNVSPDHGKTQNAINKLFAGHPVTNFEYGSLDDFDHLGLQTACSLCEELTLIIYKDNIRYRQDYKKGIAQHDLFCHASVHEPGMELLLLPDQNIFNGLTFSKEYIEQWLESKPNRRTYCTIQ